MKHTRQAVLAQLRNKVACGLPIVGGGAGTGISAKCEEAGGIDLIVIYNSGRYRMAGRGSLSGLLAYGNANQVVKEMASEVLTAVRETPVLAGVCGTDPFMIREHFLRELRDLGFAGIQNFPTVGLIDGVFRANLEETGMSYRLEVDCIAAAHEMICSPRPRRARSLAPDPRVPEGRQRAERRASRQLFWAWGDTAMPHYPLGIFHMSSATTDVQAAGVLRAAVAFEARLLHQRQRRSARRGRDARRAARPG